MELLELWEAEKTLASAGEWIERDPARKSNYLTFVSALEIEGVTIAGLRLRGTAFKHLPDETVTFQLEYHQPRQHGSALGRVEWRPIKSHDNKGLGPVEYRFRKITGSHKHPFDLNWRDAAKQIRRGNLPIAIPIDLEIKDFYSLLEVVGKEFRIKQIDKVPLPPWTPRLV